MKKDTKIGIIAGLICAILLGYGISHKEVNRWFTHEKGASVTIVNLDGDWKQSNGNVMQAHISHGEIQIKYVNATAFDVYWYGSFDADQKTGDSFDVVSNNYHPAGEMFSSKADTKTFTYDNGVLSYDFTALGQTKTVKMTKGS